jgi:hypothetical protein
MNNLFDKIMLNYYYPAILLKKMRIFALEFILIAIAMNNVSFPKITTTVQAEPWAEGHVARFTSTRVVPQTPRPHRNITANVLPR